MLNIFRKNQDGQALVEFALLMPLCVMVFCAIIDFSWLLLHEINVTSAVKEGARKGIVCVNDSDFEDKVVERVKSIAVIMDDEKMNVDVQCTNTAKPSDGDVIVSLEYDLDMLTPMSNLIFDGTSLKIHDSCRMKAE